MAGDIPTISWDKLLTSKDGNDYLGAGSFSQVYRCYHHAHGHVAVKILSSSGRDPIHSFSKEGSVHFKANNFPHILTLLGITQHISFVGLVLEYMPYGTLAELINNLNIGLPWTFRLRALSEAAAAVAYLHNLSEDKKIVHCDLKSENILLNSDLHVKISDFGGANFSNFTGISVEQSRSSHPSKKSLIQYTLSHVAPEVIDRLDACRTAQTDVYSFAIVMYTVTSRCQPFRNCPYELIPQAVKQGQRPTLRMDEVEEQLKADGDAINLPIFSLMKHLMVKCWDHNPKDRLPMIKVRDSLGSKLNSIPMDRVAEDIHQLKCDIGPRKVGPITNLITVWDKYRQINSGSLGGSQGNIHTVLQSRQQAPFVASPQATLPLRQQVPSVASPQPTPPLRRQMPRVAPPQPTPPPHQQVPPVSPSQPTTSSQPPQPALVRPQYPPPPDYYHVAGQVAKLNVDKSTRPKLPGQRETQRREPALTATPLSPTSTGIQEFEVGFLDPFLRVGNCVTMISDVAAIKNAQIGHGGWNESLMSLRGMQGIVSEIEMNGDVTVNFSGISSHRFNPNSLAKIPSENDLHVGDFVIIELDKELVQQMQEGHGGWVEDMHQYFSQLGLIFRFMNDRDVLVVYKNGKYFRFNIEVLQKSGTQEQLDYLCLQDNPHIKIGDYVWYDFEDEVVKELQKSCGGWNSTMSELRGKVGKLVYVDYHGRAFVAYSSKLCFVFNPVVISKLSREEALQRYIGSKNEAMRMASEKAALQTRYHRFAVEDEVRVHLPLDIVVELQRGHGGWCYQMLEVYGLKGIVKEFDEKENAQVLFPTGNKWSFNPATLEKIPNDGNVPAPSYTPPFRIGDKVKVKLKEVSNLNLNVMRQAFRMLEIPEEKAEILMKTGEVLGIDDDIDVIVSFGDGKNYGLKPEQLQKI